MGKSNNKFDWTDYVTLKEYFEARLDAIDKATNIAYGSMQERLAGMNEFREQLKDQAGRFVTRQELHSELEAIKINIRTLELARAELQGKASQTSVYIAYAFTALGILVSIIKLLL